MSDDATTVLEVRPLDFVWDTVDPFLFCVHHDDRYPRGNGDFGPAVSLAGRDIGQDFSGRDGFSMYHGDVVPGFPQHPHRGFETVTIVRRGLIDHSDSLGAAARFGRGDVQWLTAGKGIVHSEMFPLLERDKDNPVELFQIWLNLPPEDKMVEPHFSMLWSESIPRLEHRDSNGKRTDVTVIAGALGALRPAAPPPQSWAARPDSDVAIWTLRMDPGATYTLPPAKSTSRRSLYFFAGESASISGKKVRPKSGARLRADAECVIENGALEGELLLLQARPIARPVAQHGPFVMNTRSEIIEAFNDYQRTRFGGWPWPSDGPVHGAEPARFARHADGRIERREG
jgi:redox-sensitive bicupin YhaK (pirin superfamily)